MTDRSPSDTHFAVLGAGPTGLDAALALAERGFSFTLYEAAPEVAGHIAAWRHVRLFTPWSMNVSPRMRAALEGAGIPVPSSTTECPTGGELIDMVFRPLTELPELRNHLLLHRRVVSIGRQGLLKHEEIASKKRALRPFRLLTVDAEGREHLEAADIVLDCTGNGKTNSLGDAGIPALGERHLESRIEREIPHFPVDDPAWAGQRILLVGAGHSAQTALRGLLELTQRHPTTRVDWVVKGDGPRADDDDPLPERRELMALAQKCLEEPPPGLVVHRAVVDELAELPDGGLEVTLRHDEGNSRLRVDRILALTGRVGDAEIYRQLQIHECYATGAPMKLAAALIAQSGGSGGDCLSQASLGPETLRSPEPGFFILGSKSYGRRTDFLLRVGWQQVDEVFALLD